MDYIRLLRSTSRTVRDCCVLVFTETWLTFDVPDSAVHLERLACYRADRAIVQGGKSRGGGICVYIRDEWCRDSVVVCKHCSPLAEFVMIKCRPFYLPRKFTAILLVAVYIPPSNIEGDRIAALSELYQAVSEQQTAHPDGFAIFAGDFNHTNLKSVLPRLHQHVDFPTRGDSFLDLVYSSHKGAFKVAPLPHLGLSDHITVMLLPAYRQMVRASRPVRKRVRVWPEGASDALRDCFGSTDWDMFWRAATCDDRTDIEDKKKSILIIRKAAGPDNIPGRALKDCTGELTDVFTDIFNTSLQQAIVPSCFKAATIVPVPKKPAPSCFNDYRPVALTPIIMNCFERLVMEHIRSVLPPTIDPFQFAYRAKRSSEDAICSAFTYLERRDSYVRLLSVDFSSAFNTIVPHQRLMSKLDKLGLSTYLCNWLLDFLCQRPQVVRVGDKISASITLSIGAPQGCMLSPLLFTLLTHDCTATTATTA
ncbi:uncharacterized protein ACBT44_006665 [Syngnathus typhle]